MGGGRYTSVVFKHRLTNRLTGSNLWVASWIRWPFSILKSCEKEKTGQDCKFYEEKVFCIWHSCFAIITLLVWISCSNVIFWVNDFCSLETDFMYWFGIVVKCVKFLVLKLSVCQITSLVSLQNRFLTRLSPVEVFLNE